MRLTRYHMALAKAYAIHNGMHRLVEVRVDIGDTHMTYLNGIDHAIDMVRFDADYGNERCARQALIQEAALLGEYYRSLADALRDADVGHVHINDIDEDDDPYESVAGEIDE